jgi:hypothetical protein
MLFLLVHINNDTAPQSLAGPATAKREERNLFRPALST